ncbi:MAG: hypothetical protein JSV63_01390 [Candidatus Aenigmatarchaeota archaeon]|nr:MAG: hypothetical protein JSV63_01390 [Candidatus Aenigmarchaeota archaeon]
MEKEKLKVFLQMVTGFLLMAIANMGLWYSTEVLGLVASLAIGVAGFFLTLSKALVFYDVGYCKNVLFILIVGFFIFLVASFTPVWCYEIVNVTEGWKTCSYMNFWEFYFYPK